MISQESIAKVKDAVMVLDVVSDFIKLKKEGSSYKGLCPFHNEKSGSFSVSPSMNIYKCFGCGAAGDGIKFIQEHEKISYIEAIRRLAEKYNIELEETGKEKKYIRPIPRLEKVSKKVLDYFEKDRGISNNTLLRFKITESNEWMPQFQKEVPAICFNYFNRNNELVNIKFRGPQKSFKLAKDAELIFYNLPSILTDQECVIVEGEIDCMSLYEAGVLNCISVPNGASTGNQRLEYFDNCWDLFETKNKVILMLDNDGPGNNLKEELARRIGYNKCFIVTYPKGCKDANDVLVKHGKEELRNVVDYAREWPIEGVVTMDDMYETICDFYENGYPKGDKAGLGWFDDKLSFYPGQLTIITGVPGSGKSEFVDWLMASLTKNKGWTWGIMSFENPPEFHVTKLAEKFVDKSFDVEKPNRMNTEEFGYAIGMIDKHFNFINLTLVDVTMEGLISKAAELVKTKGIKGLLFDPWNCIEAKYVDGNETRYVLDCLNMLIAFLEKHRVHGFLVAHPTKMKKVGNVYEIPTLYSISGSAHFFNRTHNGMTIWRDFETNIVKVFIQKVKWSWLGQTGECWFDYDINTRRYKQISVQRDNSI